ncbi:hypothetical protein, partial [Klebsiella pneumoniae]|uniref:hypothetical protein n=1 Tax=Klebsiella pneumoniae TaxID=573 RepID=UPI001F5C3CD0
ASFQRLSDTINELRTTGNSAALPAFARLQGISGQQIRLNGKLEESFGDLAEAAKGTAERAGSSTASFLLRQAGYSEATINLLLQGAPPLRRRCRSPRDLAWCPRPTPTQPARWVSSMRTCRTRLLTSAGGSARR